MIQELSLHDSDITDGLLIEILIRLPLKSIFLFKTVSKRWFSLICDPFFARSYVTRINNDSSLSRSNQPFMLLFTLMPQDTVIPYLTSSNPTGFSDLSSSVFSLSFLPVETEDLVLCLNILGSSNGLVLCSRQVYPLTYYVCNPLTKQYVILPKPASFSHEVDAGIICQDDGSYTVVRIPDHESSSKMIELEIFSSETGTWRELNFSCPVLNYSRSNGWFYSTVSCNGILYLNTDKRIFAYDPCRSTDQCYSMDLPKCIESFVRYSLSICCGRLCCLGADNGLTLWELTNNESGKWHLKRTSKRSDICSTYAGLYQFFRRDELIYIWPLAMHPFDWDTVYGICGNLGKRRLFTYNFGTRILEVVDYGLIPASLHPFVHPPWPTLIPQPSWGPNDL